MIRVQTSNHSTNSGISTPCLSHESPLRRVLKFGRRTSSRTSSLYNDLASVDSYDACPSNIRQPEIQQHREKRLSNDGVTLSLDKIGTVNKKGGEKLPSMLALDVSNKTKLDGPGVEGISSAIDKLLLALSSDEEQFDAVLMRAKREKEASFPPTSPNKKNICKRSKPRRATTINKPDNPDSLLIPSNHIMSPRRHPRTKVPSTKASPNPVVGGSERLCKTDHEALKKPSHRNDGLRRHSAHPFTPPLERSPKVKVKKEQKSLDASPEVRRRHKFYSSPVARNSPKNSPKPSPQNVCKRIAPWNSTSERAQVHQDVARALIHGPSLLLTATPRHRMRRRSSTGSKTSKTWDGLETPRIQRNQAVTPIRRSKPRSFSRKNKKLEKVVETLSEAPDLEVATKSPCTTKGQPQPKRRNSLYISIYNSTPLLESVSNTSESLYITPNNSLHREQASGVARTGWVPSPSGHRRHLEISWDGNNSAPALLATSDISESNGSDPSKYSPARTQWVPSPSGHRRHLEISWK